MSHADAYSSLDESELRKRLPDGHLSDIIVDLVRELQSSRGIVTAQTVAARAICEQLRIEHRVELRAFEWDAVERTIARIITEKCT